MIETCTSTESHSPVERDERWVTKQELADHLGVSRRWIELQQRVGLPYLHMGGINRYSIIEVKEWLREKYTATADTRSA